MSYLMILIFLLELFSFNKCDLMLDRVRREGINIELYHVTTDDGYILGLYHLIRTAANTSRNQRMLFMHGLSSSSQDFVMYMNTSAGYYFYNRGFDVWLGNARGNTFSRNHTTLDPDEAEFWKFSWHEIGIYDLPAMIDFILAQTKQKQLIYAGHSQGGSIITVLLCERPEYNTKISSAHLLAGAVVTTNAKPTILLPLLMTMNEVKVLFETIGIVELFPMKDFGKITKIFAEMCTALSVFLDVCHFVFRVAVGPRAPRSFYREYYLDAASANPNGASYMQLVHYAQVFIAGRFMKFDHGASKNMQLYGSALPPAYNMSNIQTKIHIMYGTNDYLMKPENILGFANQIKGSVVAVDKMNAFNHLDFILGKMVHLVPMAILRVIQELA